MFPADKDRKPIAAAADGCNFFVVKGTAEGYTGMQS